MKEKNIEKIITQFIKATNAFDVQAALVLFAKDAVIDDVSVGNKFKHTAGVRNYLETYFVGYQTVMKLESLEIISPTKANAQVDFKGNFGHETGALNVMLNEHGLISTIHAYLD